MSLEGLYIMVTAACIAVSCGLIGAFLMLRKMAMLGDAISHAVLPGIVLAFLISGSRDNLIMLLGAAVVGVFTTVLIELLHKKARLQEDASIGVSFTWLFAVGVILISAYTADVDLDQDCVLYGEIAYVPLDLWQLSNGLIIGPRPLYIAGMLLLVIVLVIWRGYKGLVLTTFNPDYAAALGISTAFWHFGFMGLVSVTTVVSFESVGAILVVALMIAPSATAYLLTGSLKKMLWLTACFGVLTAIGGYYLALVLDGSIAGAMASVGGFYFALAFAWSRAKQKWLKAEKQPEYPTLPGS
jgi:manganese/zinc/iron transport system permease protein